MSLRDDPELGVVRFCTACNEEWPYDPEFWHLRDGELNRAWPARCIACCAEYFASRRRLAQQIAKAERVHLLPDRTRCGSPLRSGQYCGRLPNHKGTHRSVEAVRSDARRQAVNYEARRQAVTA